MKRYSRSERVSEELLKEISLIIQNDLKDPRLPSFISVTRVELSKDLRNATVRISVYGDDEAKKGTMEALESAAGYVRTLLGQRMRIRTTPILAFRLDDSIERGVHIDKILKEVLPANEENEEGEEEK